LLQLLQIAEIELALQQLAHVRTLLVQTLQVVSVDRAAFVRVRHLQPRVLEIL
jgi:hypothetical protein